MQYPLWALMFITLMQGCNPAPPAHKSDDIEAKKEISKFLKHYGDLIEKNRFDSLWTLYEKEGAIRSGAGYNGFETLDSIKKEYASLSLKSKSFEWRNPRIDILSPDVAMITSQFTWVTDMFDDTARSTYTGILRKTGNNWALMHEHETWDWETSKKLSALMEKTSKADTSKPGK